MRTTSWYVNTKPSSKYNLLYDCMPSWLVQYFLNNYFKAKSFHTHLGQINVLCNTTHQNSERAGNLHLARFHNYVFYFSNAFLHFLAKKGEPQAKSHRKSMKKHVGSVCECYPSLRQSFENGVHLLCYSSQCKLKLFLKTDREKDVFKNVQTSLCKFCRLSTFKHFLGTQIQRMDSSQAEKRENMKIENVGLCMRNNSGRCNFKSILFV